MLQMSRCFFIPCQVLFKEGSSHHERRFKPVRIESICFSTVNVRSVALSIPWPSNLFPAKSHEAPKTAVALNSRAGGPAQ